MDFIKEWGMIAGIAGIGLGVFVVLFRNILSKKIFPKLTKKQSLIVLLCIMVMTWLLAIFSIWMYYSNDSQHKNDDDLNRFDDLTGDSTDLNNFQDDSINNENGDESGQIVMEFSDSSIVTIPADRDVEIIVDEDTTTHVIINN
ncbi:MAG: hypothetical protein QNK23_13860 [Crocinitomicaceae bacterium]|nr:hypothetical protein [Crocinitomicaceae bacterium]